MKLEIITKNSDETTAVAKKYAACISAPKIISLKGDLGAGKTTFSKGFAEGLGIEELVTSPTFTLLNEYTYKNGNLYHFDMYRLESVEEAFELGFEEYFNTQTLNGIVLVEWAENVKGLLPKNITEITFEKTDDNTRKIIIEDKNEDTCN